MMLNWLAGKYEPPKTELPLSWQDQRIVSCAEMLGKGPDTYVDPESVKEATNLLAEVGEELGLDPDQIHRALTEHEPFLGPQDTDIRLLKKGFFRFLGPWDPREEEI